MQSSAWIFMGLVWTLIIGSVVYCFWRLLTSSIQLGGDDESAVAEPPQSEQP